WFLVLESACVRRWFGSLPRLRQVRTNCTCKLSSTSIPFQGIPKRASWQYAAGRKRWQTLHSKPCGAIKNLEGNHCFPDPGEHRHVLVGPVLPDGRGRPTGR